MSEQNHHIYEFGPFRLDATRRLLLRDGDPVKLFPKEFDTLLALVERSGEGLDKDELMRRVWGATVVEESNLAKNISHLRKVLGEKPNQHQYIVTIPGEGYRFVAGVRTAAFDEVSVQERTRAQIVIEEDVNEGGGDAEIRAEAETGGGGEAENLPVSPRPFVSPSLMSPRPRVSPSLPVSPSVHHQVSRFTLLVAAFVIVAVTVALFFALSQRSGGEQNKVTRLLAFQQTDIRRLAINGDPRAAVLSPDGKLFAYVINDSDMKRSLWLGHVDGGEPVQLRPPAEVLYPAVTFAPDGSSLYFTASEDVDTGGTLYRLPVLGGVPEKVKENVRYRITFSPDGGKFAFIRTHSRGSVLVIADTKGTTEREVASRPGNLNFSAQSPSWSPDGKLIAVGAINNESTQDAEVFVVSVADGSLKPLTNLAWKEVRMTGWLNDSSGLIAVAAHKRSGADSKLWHISYPAGDVRRLAADLSTYSYAVNLSADNKSLLAVRGQNHSNVWVAPADNLDQAKQITFDLLGRNNGWNGLDWTPDGHLVFTASSDDGQTLWIASSDGSGKKELLPPGHMNTFPTVTADGRYIIFASDRAGGTEIWRANTGGGDLRQLTTGGKNSQPHVSPDSKWVVYRSNDDGSSGLWRVSIDGGKPRRVTEKGGSWPRVSPDGKHIAYRNDDKLAIIPFEGGKPVKVFDVPRLANFNIGPRWTPDGTAVTYRDWANGIWKQPLEGGEPQRLAGLPTEKLYGYGWSRDGKLFAFTRGAELRDLVLIRDLR